MSTNTAHLSGNYETSHNSAQDYSDIIHLERPIVPNYPAMSSASRAAQFMPFAALTTYNEVVAEVEDNNTFCGNVIIPEVENSPDDNANYFNQEYENANPDVL